MMNVGLDYRSVDPELVAILQPQIHRRLHDQLIDGLEGCGSKAIKGPVEGVVFGHLLAAEIREGAQGVAIRDTFAEFAQVPILDPALRPASAGLARESSRCDRWPGFSGRAADRRAPSRSSLGA